LFGLLAIYSTYKLARKYYDEKTAQRAALMLSTAQGFFLMMHDVRTDTILMGAVVFSIWQLDSWLSQRKFIQFFAGCSGIAIGMMTKGPIALFVPCFALGTQVIFSNNFKVFARWEYVAGLLIIAAWLFPMSWGLYQQYDLHPETLVNGKTEVSGLRFFYWTQSFGRITGESPWNNGATIFFLLQNMLWAFLPWIIFFVWGWVSMSYQLIKDKFKIITNKELITWGGFTLSYLALGMSKYQLPHYIFVAFPLAAIMASNRFSLWLSNQNNESNGFPWLTKIHIGIFSLLWIALVVLMYFPFPDISMVYPILSFLGFVGFVVIANKLRNKPHAFITLAVYTIVGINLFLNGVFYPRLLKYQAGSSCGKWIHEQKIDPNQVYTCGFSVMRSLHFYANGLVKTKDNVAEFRSGTYAITLKDSITSFKNQGKAFDVVFTGEHYPVTLLSLPFLNPKTRPNVVKSYVLLKIK
jgi:4-amino-4-deoxy-L-arabinose transferase-like glycosyltransferase